MEGNLRFKIDWANFIHRFALYLRVIFHAPASRGLIFGGAI